jgi:signal transduction histidine kinase
MNRQPGTSDDVAVGPHPRIAQATRSAAADECSAAPISLFGLVNSAGEVIASPMGLCSSRINATSNGRYLLNDLVTLADEGWTALHYLMGLQSSGVTSMELRARRKDVPHEPYRLIVSRTYRRDLWAFELLGETAISNVSPERLKNFSSLSLGVAFFARDNGRLLWTNAAACQSMGCDPALLNWLKVQEGADTALPSLLELDQPKSFLYSNNAENNSALCAVHIEPSTYCDSEAAVLLVTFRTQRPRTDSRSRRAEQAQLFRTSQTLSVSEMASILAHELNQPLGAVNNYLAGILRRLQDGRDVPSNTIARPLEAAQKQAAHASAIIQRMRDFVRSKEPKFSAVNVRELVDSVFASIVSDAAAQDVSLQAFIPLETPRVHADAILIEQVLMNLVRNGIEASRESGRHDKSVFVRASKALNGVLRICVEDNGTGFAGHIDPDLLSPLQTTKPDGLGLGLSICRSILEIHQGQLAIERSTPEGTVFFFTLRTID